MAELWPFIGRSSELARIESLVASGNGALVVGEPGIGKTALVRCVGERVSGAMPVGRVVGHTVSNGAPFEAFAGVLTARDTALLSPVEVARRVADAFARPPGTKVLLVVDDAHLLDERSAQVLLQLAADKTAIVLATALDLELPAAVGRLWRDGWCDQFVLGGLGGGEVLALIEAVLGAPIDTAAARAFATRSQGNPLLLRELVRAALDASTLVRRGTGWTLTGEPAISSGIRGLLSSRLSALPEAQRAALETVAAGEPLGLSVAIELIGEALLDELDADRLISVRRGLAGPEVSTAHPLHGELLRADIPPLRLRRLRLSLASRLEAIEHPSPHDLVRAALWRLELGQTDEPDRLLAAARAARSLSLDTAERLARHAHELSGSLQATLLLGEILTHRGRGDEAAQLTAALPPESLTPADREAMVYCAAMGQGLMTGDTAAGADVVAGVMAGNPDASDQLRGLYAALLAFDGRFAPALDVGIPLAENAAVNPGARTFAAVAVIGAHYWLGHSRRAVELADVVAPIAATVRDTLPFAAASAELIAICALLEMGALDVAEERSRRLRTLGETNNDVFAAPRGEYCLARVQLQRGRAATALRGFQRCVTGMAPFDRPFLRHVSSMLARAAAAAGDVSTARQCLDACADAPRIKTYEAEFELAVAAVYAAELRMAEAADHAAWAAGIAADHEQWNVALAGYHDAARYGSARSILIPLRAAASYVDGQFAWCLLDHVSALAAQDPVALDEVARRFEAHGTILLAAEAAAEAAVAHTAAQHQRAARAAAVRAATLYGRCEGATSPWLAGAGLPVALTARERQIAVLAEIGNGDAAIADRLGISVRTVQTHLARVYTKLGITSRQEIGAHLRP